MTSSYVRSRQFKKERPNEIQNKEISESVTYLVRYILSLLSIAKFQDY